MAAGRYLRANNSLAPSFGSLGLANGGSGFGLTVPLSWASAAEALTMAEISRGIRNRRGCMRRKTSMECMTAGQCAAAPSPLNLMRDRRIKLKANRDRVRPLQDAEGTRKIAAKY